MKHKTRFWKWLGWIILGLAAALLSIMLILNPEHLDLTPETALNSQGDFIELSQGWVHYQLLGPADGDVVVLVHGFSVPLYVWDPTAEFLSEKGYRVLSFDLYGRGFSARPDVTYDTDLFVDQLEELLGALEIKDPVVLAGLSMGGPITARFSDLHPEQVRGLVLIAPEVTPTTSSDVFPLNLPLVGEYLMKAIMEPILLPKLQAEDFVHPENYPAWESKYRVQLQYHGTGRALLSTIRSLTTYDPTEDFQLLRKTGIPVLLVWGEEDQTVSADQIETLEELLPDMEVLTVAEAGHLPHYERPEIVNSRLAEFIKSIPMLDGPDS